MNTTIKKIRVWAIALSTLFTLSCSDDDHNRDDEPVVRSAYEYFAEISAIPRCSGNEQAISDHLVAFGRGLGYVTIQDAALNVLIKKPGSVGRENEPPIILQAHMDMICVKDNGVDHDFGADPITLAQNGDWIVASGGTTLGADNGGGVSVIMAALASRGTHPPIEALFTTEEEYGLFGAEKFDVSQLQGVRLINLDLTTEGILVTHSERGDSDDILIALEPAALAKAARFPDWPQNENSPLRNTMVEAFRSVYGYIPLVGAININRAAVECVAFAQSAPYMDMVAIGANIEEIHTPQERMSRASHEMLYLYVMKILEML